eukprot:3752706-Rhodomonas_salina.1
MQFIFACPRHVPPRQQGTCHALHQVTCHALHQFTCQALPLRLGLTLITCPPPRGRSAHCTLPTHARSQPAAPHALTVPEVRVHGLKGEGSRCES